jgi:elongation factor Ts
MADITASMVRDLREKTDAPMMECKKALVEAEGDIDKAEEILRVKLGNKASKAASRVAAEGTVGTYISDDGKLGAIIEVNCETDFVAKNDDFLALVKQCAQLVATHNPADVEALSALPLADSTVDEVRKALIGKIGENISIRRFIRHEAKGRLTTYLHGAKIGVMVDFESADDQVGKDIAMHVAASKPICVSRDDVPADKIEQERRIFEQQAAESGKPAEIIAKMVEGRISKFIAEVALTGQPFVKNPDETVEKMLKAKNSAVHGFTLVVVGEGIEKKVTDFAAEVAAQSAAANAQR